MRFLDKYAPKAPTPAKPKAVSRFDQAAGAADARTPTSTGKHMLICGTESTARTMSSLAMGGNGESIASLCETLRGELAAMSRESPATSQATRSQAPLCASDYTSARTKDFFWDVPWGNVPSGRLATITAQPAPYKGGLLGGSSKLAALAAKRKQKQQEAAAKADAAANGHAADKAVALLDRLNIRENHASAPIRDDTKPRYPRRRSETPPPPEPDTVEEEPITEPQGTHIEFPNLRAKQPSMFGAVLCGSPLDEPKKQHVESALSTFPLPYANTKAFTDADPFSKPSPDDLVRQAQARSAGAGR